jgi:hypothetical protein
MRSRDPALRSGSYGRKVTVAVGVTAFLLSSSMTKVKKSFRLVTGSALQAVERQHRRVRGRSKTLKSISHCSRVLRQHISPADNADDRAAWTCVNNLCPRASRKDSLDMTQATKVRRCGRMNVSLVASGVGLIACLLSAPAASAASPKPSPPTGPSTQGIASGVLAATLSADAISAYASPEAAWVTSHSDPQQGQNLSKMLGKDSGEPQAVAAAKSLGSLIYGTKLVADGLEVAVSTAPTPEVYRQMSALAASGVKIHVRWVKNSLATLEGVTQAISKDQRYWSARGWTLSSWGPDYEKNLVSVSFTKPASQSVQLSVAARYGGMAFVAPPVPIASRFSRGNDGSPFYGGDDVRRDSNGGHCTTGFSLKKSSLPWISTAGHCGGGPGSGSQPKNTSHNGSFSDYNHYMGSIYARGFLDRGLDWEVLTGDGYEAIWAGRKGQTPFLRNTTSVSTQEPKNGKICISGAVSLEVCGVTIYDGIERCIYFGDVTTCHIIVTTSATQPCGYGDSGAPVYTAINGNYEAEARGMVVGGAYDIVSKYICYYTPIRYVASAFGGSVLLS